MSGAVNWTHDGFAWRASVGEGDDALQLSLLGSRERVANGRCLPACIRGEVTKGPKLVKALRIDAAPRPLAIHCAKAQLLRLAFDHLTRKSPARSPAGRP